MTVCERCSGQQTNPDGGQQPGFVGLMATRRCRNTLTCNRFMSCHNSMYCESCADQLGKCRHCGDNITNRPVAVVG